MYSKESGPHYKTVFTIFENRFLKTALEKFAKENNLKIFLGEPSTPDIYVMPFFLSIVDRNILGTDVWNDYLKYDEEVEEYGDYLIIIDDRNDLTMPKYQDSYHLPISAEDSILDIISTCKKIVIITEPQRCLCALLGNLYNKTTKELQDEILFLMKKFPCVKDYFFNFIVVKDGQGDKKKKLSNYFLTRSDEELILFIKYQFSQFCDIQQFYIKKMKGLYFSKKEHEVYLR
jgi:hypothetical protein